MVCYLLYLDEVFCLFLAVTGVHLAFSDIICITGLQIQFPFLSKWLRYLDISKLVQNNVSPCRFKTYRFQLLLGFESIINGVCDCKEEVVDAIFFALGRLLMLFHVSFLYLLDQKVVTLLLCCAILKLISCGSLSR